MALWQSTGRLWSLTEWAADAEWRSPAIPERVLFSVHLADLN
ncbi:hypothetical protein [Streptomyces olivoreticuli]|nr:hypothetical protein [Streptomyces olivoreticuli]